MSKKSERIKDENDRAYVVDSYLIYLEASDFRPIAKNYYPVHALFIKQFKPSGDLKDYLNPRVSPCGFIFRGRLPGTFSVDEVFPFQPSIMSKALMPKIPTGAVLANVCTSTVWTDGRCARSAPKRFYWHSDFGINNQWISVNPSRAVGSKRIVTPKGDEVNWSVVGSERGGFLPAFAVHYKTRGKALWQVSISAENGLSSLLLPTDEAGVKGFYDLREGPYSGTRRSALQHFVRTHCRQKADGESPVRCHFRGREEFDWFGLKCKILPPEKIADQVHESKLQGAA